MRRPPAPTRALAAVALALTLAGCSGGSGGLPTTTVGDGEVTTTLVRTVTGAVDLRRLVVSNAPVGYQLLASPPFGAVDLTRLLDQFSDAPEDDKAILEKARFKGGYTRGWLRDDPRAFLGVFVFDFADEEGARSAGAQFAAQNVDKKNAGLFPVEGITDAVGESYTNAAEGEPPERVHLVSFVRGSRLYQVSGQFADENAPTAETVAFARIEDQIAA